MSTKKDTNFDGINLPQHDEGISADIKILKEYAKKTVKNSEAVAELNAAEQMLVFLQAESSTDPDYAQEINVCKNRIIELKKAQEEAKKAHEEAAARAHAQAEARKKREREEKARLAETQQRQKEAALRQERRKKLIVVAVCGILVFIVAYVIISSVVSTIKDIREEKAKYDPSNVSFTVTGMAPGEFENNSYTTVIQMTVQNGCTLDLAEVRGNLIVKDSQTEEVLWRGKITLSGDILGHGEKNDFTVKLYNDSKELQEHSFQEVTLTFQYTYAIFSDGVWREWSDAKYIKVSGK
ncbi:MAG TPA: hypothetical protein DCW73_01605 [Treponema sp.]|nr:hypothetical protein [Treponema sp.]